jgi:hypothetical protein
MVVRLVRAGVGALLLLIAVPLALAGGGLLLAMEHRAADDTFTARLERVRVDGTAVVVPDVDALLRADAPFARGGQTTLSLSAVGAGGPLFIGLGESNDVRRYLDGAAQSRLTRVRLARGPLPVELTTTAAARRESPSVLPPADPAAAAPADAEQVRPSRAVPGEQKFWRARSEQRAGAAELTWSPSALRGRHLSLVIMRADGAPGIDAALTARLVPAWLGPTTGGLLMLGSALFFLALLTIAWPQRRPSEPLAALTVPAQPRPELPAAPAVFMESAVPDEPKAEVVAPEVADETKPSKSVLATLADVLAAADAEAAEKQPRPAEVRNVVLVTECELDGPAPEGVDLDDNGPIQLPPLPALPAIELQFTWAPLAFDEPAEGRVDAARS